MKEFKDRFIIGLIIIGFCAIIYGIGFVKHKVWRAEHPHAESWTFFVPSRK